MSCHPLQAEKHHPALVKVLCSELDVVPESLLDFELCLTDTQPAVSLQMIHQLPVSQRQPGLTSLSQQSDTKLEGGLMK